MRADACFLQALASFETNTRAAETGKQDTGKEINFLQSRKLTVKVFYEGWLNVFVSFSVFCSPSEGKLPLAFTSRFRYSR